VPGEVNSPSPIVPVLRGLAGAVVGAAAGYWLAGWALRQGFYAMALPGGLLGLGYGLAARRYSPVGAVVCAIAAVPVGLFTEWAHMPFVRDASLDFFLRNLGALRGMTWLMVGLGAVGAYWFAIGTRSPR
jgi:hypothetical protein